MGMTLNGQVAIITGASSGIGTATARELSSAGMRLVLTARRQERLESLAGELAETVWLAGDITEPELPQRLVDLALDSFGRCDVVFNNAGVIETFSIEEADLDRLARMARVNVEAVFRMCYVALKHFRSVGGGHLVNTSSILGMKVRPHVGAYAGTKYAIEALTEALRLELAGSDIKVSCLEPGLVLTELHSHWPVHPAQFMNIKHPLQPPDVARCVRFILEQPDHVRIARLLVLPGEQQL